MTKKVETAAKSKAKELTFEAALEKLTVRQVKFIDELINRGGKRIGEAAVAAGYPQAGASNQATRLMKKPEFTLVYNAELELMRERNRDIRQKVLNEHAKIAFSNVLDVATWDDTRMRPHPSARMTRAQAAPICEVSEVRNQVESTVRVKLYDKQKSLVELAKLMGLYETDNADGGAKFDAMNSDEKLETVCEIISRIQSGLK